MGSPGQALARARAVLEEQADLKGLERKTDQAGRDDPTGGIYVTKYLRELYHSPSAALLDKAWAFIQFGGTTYVTLFSQFSVPMKEEMESLVTSAAIFTGFGKDILLRMDIQRKARKALHKIGKGVSEGHLDTDTATRSVKEIDMLLREKGARKEPIYKPMKNVASVIFNAISTGLQKGTLSKDVALVQFNRLCDGSVLTFQEIDGLKEDIRPLDRELMSHPHEA